MSDSASLSLHSVLLLGRLLLLGLLGLLGLVPPVPCALLAI